MSVVALDTVASVDQERPIPPEGRAPDAAPLPSSDDGGRFDLVTGADGVTRPSWAARTALARDWFDTEWGRGPVTEQGLFELVALFVFAGGLTWSTVLGRRDALRAAFAGFDPDVVAGFSDDHVRHLVEDERIIRNVRKVRAVVTNARATCGLRAQGGLVEVVRGHLDDESRSVPVHLASVPRCDARSEGLATALRQAGFVHLGGVAAQSLLLASGLIPVERSGPGLQAATSPPMG